MWRNMAKLTELEILTIQYVQAKQAENQAWQEYYDTIVIGNDYQNSYIVRQRHILAQMVASRLHNTLVQKVEELGYSRPKDEQ
jgi:hypothetical protein